MAYIGLLLLGIAIGFMAGWYAIDIWHKRWPD